MQAAISRKNAYLGCKRFKYDVKYKQMNIMLLQNHYAEIPLGQLSAFSDKTGGISIQ